MRKAAYVFAVLAILLACVMCATVAYCYRGMLCAVRHGGTSAPASVAFLLAIPFGLAVAGCMAAAWICYKKSGKGED